jgi:hypothetical protein
LILSCYQQKQIEYIQFQQLMHYNREIQRQQQQQQALYSGVGATDHHDQSLQCAFEPIPAMELAPMAPEMRTTSLGDADPGTNRTRSDAKGSSFVVNLTADNYPEGATLHTNDRPNSAIPVATARSKGSGVSPHIQRKKADNR